MYFQVITDNQLPGHIGKFGGFTAVPLIYFRVASSIINFCYQLASNV